MAYWGDTSSETTTLAQPRIHLWHGKGIAHAGLGFNLQRSLWGRRDICRGKKRVAKMALDAVLDFFSDTPQAFFDTLWYENAQICAKTKCLFFNSGELSSLIIIVNHVHLGLICDEKMLLLVLHWEGKFT